MKFYLFSGDNVKRKTKTIKESLNPVWNETLKMWVAHLIWLMEKTGKIGNMRVTDDVDAYILIFFDENNYSSWNNTGQIDDDFSFLKQKE